jgi:hypothetical protein
MTGTPWAFAAVDRVEHQHLRAVGQRGLGLLLLLRRVLIGVRVDDLAVRAQLRDLLLEEGAVRRLVAGGLALGEQQRDRSAARGGPPGVRAVLVVVAAGRQAEGEDARGEGGDDRAPLAS